MQRLVELSDDEQILVADREQKELEELFELDQKYLLKEEDSEENDIYAREARRFKDGQKPPTFKPLKSPFIDY